MKRNQIGGPNLGRRLRRQKLDRIRAAESAREVWT